MKKFLAILLTLTLLLGLCACGGGGEKEQTGNKADGDKITLSVGIATNAKILSLDDNALTNWLEDQCNVEIKFVEYAGGTSVATQISTTVAARQELPDILYGFSLGTGAITTYGKDGYFVDLTPYYEDKEGASKTFWSRIEESLTPEQQDTVVRKITNAETGKIYGVPSVETSTIDKRRYQPWINQKWLDKLGLSMPQNNQELYDVLVAFDTRDPNGNGDPNDEIPLMASEKAGSSCRVVDWLMNTFLYYNEHYEWQDYNGDGQLEYVYTQDAYREGLQFIRKLYQENLLTNMVYTASGTELKQIHTPASGQAMCGIFLGHLTVHTTMGNEVMYDYVPMPLWGCAVENELSCNLKTFITADCDYPDKAFEVLMTLWSWEGSMRVRYGEFGVNWTYPDEGAKSDMGLDANYKLISDPFTQQNTAHWGSIASCFNHYAEGETAQIAENMDEWTAKKSAMHAESRRIFEAALVNNPENLCPALVYTTEEEEAMDAVITNIEDVVGKQEMAFVTGTTNAFDGATADIYSDASWQAYMNQLKKLGLDEYHNYVQTAYDRQK